jgi:ubiquinone/menaquinone biosynthesis C-methylase UbiE
MIDLARQYNRHENSCTYYVNVRDDLALFADDTFNFVYSNITLQHVAPTYTLRYIREFLRILSPNGLLVFQLPESHVPVRGRSLRQRMKRALPKVLLAMYRKVRYGGLKPVMQMYGIKKEIVLTLIEENGGDIVQVEREPMGEANWSSYLYFVRKTSPAISD